MPIYEGDGGLWLKRTSKMGKRVVPGSNRSLFPCNVRAVLPQVKEEAFFTSRGRPPLRARRGVAEQVIGYKFNGDVSVAFRGTSGQFGTSVKIGPAVKAAVDSMAPEDAQVLIGILNGIDLSWWEVNSEVDLGSILQVLRDAQRQLKNPRAQKSAVIQKRGAIACLRRISLQALVIQNVPTEDFTEAGEFVGMEMEALMDDLSDLDLDFF